MQKRRDEEEPVEIAIVGDLTDSEADLTDRLLSVEPGGECTIYFDSPGGSPYCAVSLMTLIQLRDIKATGIVTGECSSATLWPFAACKRRIVTPYSVMLFHPMRWQSEENVGLAEAAEWARHFGHLEQEMDELLGPPVRRLAEPDARMDQPGPLRDRPRAGRRGHGGTGRARQAAPRAIHAPVEPNRVARIPPIIRPHAARRLRKAPAAKSQKKSK